MATLAPIYTGGGERSWESLINRLVLTEDKALLTSRT